MIVFGYLYYRMYRAYAARNDTPGVRTFQYVSLVLFFLVGGVWLLVEPCLGNAAAQRALHRPGVWVLVIASVLLITFFGFSRTPFSRYEQRFAGHTALNQRVKTWLLIVLPFAFLFGSVAVRVFLFGGAVFGTPVTGLLRGH
jgi:hypothetical protein